MPLNDPATNPLVHRTRYGGLSRSFRRKGRPLGGTSSPDAIEHHGAKRISLDSPYFRYPLYSSYPRDLTALRYDDWKIIFMEKKAEGTFRVWMEPFVQLRVPMIENLRRDPYERASITSNTYYDWMLDRAFLLVPAQAYVAEFLGTFQDIPPRQKAASFSLDKVMEKMNSGAAH